MFKQKNGVIGSFASACILSLMLLLFSHVAFPCGRTPGGLFYCDGPCPPELPICGADAHGACSCKTVTEDTTDGEPKLEVSKVSMGLTLSGAEGGPEMFTPGNTITVTQLDAIDFTITHTADWGGGTETVHIPAGAAAATIKISSVEDGVVAFDVLSFSGFLASFASVALDGDQTGDNIFSMPSAQSGGTLNLATGRFHANAYVALSNAVFTDDPAVVQAAFSGSFDPSTNTATIHHVRDGSGDVLVVVSDSPGGDRPF